MPNSILAIDSAGILVLRDYEENIKRMLELLQEIDVLPQQPGGNAAADDHEQLIGEWVWHRRQG